MPVAYHAEQEIDAIALGVGVPLAVLVVALSAYVLLRWPDGDGGNPAARRALVGSLLLLPLFMVAGGLLTALVLPALAPVALLLYSVVALRRIGAGGRKREAVAAFCLSGLITAYAVPHAIACIAVGGCFH